MIVLDATDETIEVDLDAAHTTNALKCFACYRDITTTAYTPGNQAADTNGTTEVTAISAPAASTQRVVDYIGVYNADTATHAVTIKFDKAATESVLCKRTVQAGQTLYYQEGTGWATTDVYAPTFALWLHSDAGAAFTMTNATQAERFAGNSNRHIVYADLTYYTQVRLLVNVVTASASVNTPKMRVKYATTFTTVGGFSTLGSSEIEVSVFTGTGGTIQDTGWVNLVTNAKAGVYLAMTEVGGDATADPAVGTVILMFR